MIEYYKNFSLEPLFYINHEGLVCQEIFKDIPNYEGFYQASDLGRIKSVSRRLKNNRKVGFSKEKIITQFLDIRKVYLTTRLHLKGKSKRYSSHVLTAMVFLGHIPDGTTRFCVDHIKNQEKANNCIWNLQIITNRHNISKDRINNTSKYTGVSWVKEKKKFVASIQIEKKQNKLGYFNNEYDAHLAYQKALYNYETFGILPFKEKRVFSSNYTGVSWYKSLNKWKCAIVFNKKIKHIGYFENELDAHKAYLNAEKQIKEGAFKI